MPGKMPARARNVVLSPDMQYKTNTMGKQPIRVMPDPNLQMLQKALKDRKSKRGM